MQRDDELSPKIRERNHQSWVACKAEWKRARKAEDDAYEALLKSRETK